MSKTIIAMVLCFVLCFTFILPPQRSNAIAFVPAMPVVLGLLKAAGLTALTVGGANYLYNEFYNYIPSEMRTAIDSLNNGSVAVLAGGVLSYLSPFALTKSMGNNSAVVETTGSGMYQLNTWYEIDTRTMNLNDIYRIDGINTNTTNGYFKKTYQDSSRSSIEYNVIGGSGQKSHYYGYGNMKFMFVFNGITTYLNLLLYDINGNIQNIKGTTIQNSFGDMEKSYLATLGYLTATDYLDKSLDYSGSISADRVLDPNGDIKPEAVVVPGSVTDFLNNALPSDSMPSDYINAGAQDVAVNGWTGSDTNTGDTPIDLTGTNDLLTGIRGVADTIATGVGTLVNSVATGVTALTGTIATGIGALTDFVVPDVTLDFSGFQNLGALMVQKFPFSLPWDLKNLVMSFNADPEPIKFENLVIYKNPYNDVMYDIDFDLTEWEWLAAITRYFILASFSLGLIFKTRDLIRS